MRQTTPNPQRRRLLVASAVSVASGAAGLLLPGAARAAGYPNHSITFICPWPPGGTGDQSMRALCQVASQALGQSIIVENRSGASGMIGTRTLAAAKPDGYTIGQIPISVTRFSQLGTFHLDPRKDLTYIARTSGQTFGIATLSSSAFQSLKDMVDFAKANPGKLTYGHSGIGGATHVGMEEFSQMAGIKLTAISYKGGAAALQDVIGGRVDLLADSSSWAPYVESGKLRLLATWGSQRTPRFKNVPTLRESGYDMVVEAPNGVGAPKGLDPAVEKTLRDAFRVAVNSDEFKRVTGNIDAPVMYLDGPEYLQYVKKVYTQETELIKDLKLKELMQIA